MARRKHAGAISAAARRRGRGQRANGAAPRSIRRPPLTISRRDLLVGGTDVQFRELIHDLISYAHHLETCRDGFAVLGGLSGVQYLIVMAVSRWQRASGISVGQVARRLHRSGAFITLEASKLAARGILDKRQDPRDARRVLLSLTREGERLLETLAPYQQRVNDVLFECLDRRRFIALKKLVHDLVACGDRAVHLVEFLTRQAQARAVA